MTRDRMLTLHFTDGTSISFDFPEQTRHAAAKRIMLENFLKSDNVVLEADGSLMVFPVANIKYIQFMPPAGVAEDALKGMQSAIVGATIVG
jgi:hypothetical protein